MTAIDFTPLAEAVITLLAAVITIYLIPWIKSRATLEQQTYIRMAVQVAVYAAEKLYGAGRGDEKLAYAQKVLHDQYHIELDTGKLKALVDAQIKQMEHEEGLTMIEALPEAEAVEEDEEEEPQTEEG